MANGIGHFRFGNKKLPNTTAIFNLCSATDCPSVKLGLCQAYVNGKCVCYALRPEKFRPNVLPFRRRQEKWWDSLDWAEFTTEFLNIVGRRRIKTDALRLNEAGDFRTQADVDKASKIAQMLSHHGIRVYGYTARRDLDFSKVSKNLVINGSGFKVHGEFRMITSKKEKPKGYGICPSDCRKCTRCLKGKLTCNFVH